MVVCRAVAAVSAAVCGGRCAALCHGPPREPSARRACQRAAQGTAGRGERHAVCIRAVLLFTRYALVLSQGVPSACTCEPCMAHLRTSTTLPAAISCCSLD